jgi:hypothetical protein
MNAYNHQPLQALPSYLVAFLVLSYYGYRHDAKLLLMKLSGRTRAYCATHAAMLKALPVLRWPSSGIPAASIQLVKSHKAGTLRKIYVAKELERVLSYGHHASLACQRVLQVAGGVNFDGFKGVAFVIKASKFEECEHFCPVQGAQEYYQFLIQGRFFLVVILNNMKKPGLWRKVLAYAQNELHTEGLHRRGRMIVHEAAVLAPLHRDAGYQKSKLTWQVPL